MASDKVGKYSLVEFSTKEFHLIENLKEYPDRLPREVQIRVDEAKRSGLFEDFYVWYPRKIRQGDTAIVGVPEKGKTAPAYLIARWW
jgi:ribosome-associated toxin RatA of RatAB toxin-antitoxin module